MNHAVNIWVGLENLVKRSRLSDIDIIEFGPLAADELDAPDGFLRRVVEVIGYHHLVVGFEKCQCSKRTDVASPSTIKSGMGWQGDNSWLERSYPVTRTEPTGIVLGAFGNFK